MSKTVKALAGLKGRVYVYLANQEIASRFLQDAENEGFIFEDGAKPTSRACDTVMAINHNHTINYVGAVGHIAFGSGTTQIGNEDLIRVDYRQYVKE